MKVLLLALLALLTTSAAFAQTPGEIPGEAQRLVVRADATAPAAPTRSAQPVLQVSLGTLSHLAGAFGGYYVGDAVYSKGYVVSDGGLVGMMIGGPVATAVAVSAVGRRERFGRTLLGAAVGQIAGFAVYTALSPDGDSELAYLGISLSSAAGATLANGIGD